jgi:hypothetical protein
LLAIRTEDARHPDFFTNNTFHFLDVCAIGYKTERRHTDLVIGIDLQLQSLVCSRPFLVVLLRLPQKVIGVRRSRKPEVPAVNKP